jgi:hypothetical protein
VAHVACVGVRVKEDLCINSLSQELGSQLANLRHLGWLWHQDVSLRIGDMVEFHTPVDLTFLDIIWSRSAKERQGFKRALGARMRKLPEEEKKGLIANFDFDAYAKGTMCQRTYVRFANDAFIEIFLISFCLPGLSIGARLPASPIQRSRAQ